MFKLFKKSKLDEKNLRPISDLIDESQIQERAEKKYADNREYYDKCNEDVGKISYATDPFDTQKTTTGKWKDPMEQVKRDVVIEMVIEKYYGVKVNAEYLWRPSVENVDKVYDRDKLIEMCKNYEYNGHVYEHGKDLFVIPYVWFYRSDFSKFAYFKDMYKPWYIGDERRSPHFSI